MVTLELNNFSSSQKPSPFVFEKNLQMIDNNVSVTTVEVNSGVRFITIHCKVLLFLGEGEQVQIGIYWDLGSVKMSPEVLSVLVV